MQKARQILLQAGSIILCVNGALWYMSNMRDDGAITSGQFLFRIGVFLLGLLLVGGAGLLALIEKLQGPAESASVPEPQVIDESDLIVDESKGLEEETE